MYNFLVHLSIAFLVLALLTFLSVTTVLNPVMDLGRVAADRLTYPFTGIFQVVDDMGRIFGSARTLDKENAILSEQVQELTARLAELEQVQNENQELREALGFARTSRLDLLPAEVMTVDPLSAGQSFIINRGKKEGAREGRPVVASGQVLVGVIQAAFENTSSVKLITSSDTSVNARTADGDATGIIRGEHGLGLLFDLISQSETVEPGDRIITSGLGGSLPGNLYIGEVSDIRTSSSELFQKASVVPGADLRNLRTVFVIR